MMKQEPVSIRCHNRTYVFAVRTNRVGKQFLAITEQREQSSTIPPKETVYISSEYLVKFAVVLNKMVDRFEHPRPVSPAGSGAPPSITHCG
jgi:hypothetical protein